MGKCRQCNRWICGGCDQRNPNETFEERRARHPSLYNKPPYKPQIAYLPEHEGYVSPKCAEDAYRVRCIDVENDRKIIDLIEKKQALDKAQQEFDEAEKRVYALAEGSPERTWVFKDWVVRVYSDYNGFFSLRKCSVWRAKKV